MSPRDFESARAIVEGERAVWRGPGTFYVAPYGRVGHGLAYVVAGAREWLVGGDPAYLMPDDLVRLVDLRTGEVTRTGYLAARPLLDSMTPVGPWPTRM